MTESRYRNLLRQFDVLDPQRGTLMMQAADLLVDWSYQLGHWTDMLRVADRALEATLDGDSEVRARYLFEAGAALNALGRPGEAIPRLESSLVLARHSHSFETATLALIALGASKREEDRFVEAISLYEAAFHEADLAPLVAASLKRLALNNKGVALREIGEPERAYECYLQARAISVRLRDRHALATALVNLSQIALDLRLFVLAVKYAQRALHFAMIVGATNVAMVATNNLALAHMESASWDAAQRALDRHRLLAEAQESAVDLAKNLHNVGWLRHLSGDDADAVHWLQRAIVAKSNLSGRASLAVAYQDLGAVMNALGDRAGSRENWIRALRIFDEIAPNRAVEVRAEARSAGIELDD